MVDIVHTVDSIMVNKLRLKYSDKMRSVGLMIIRRQNYLPVGSYDTIFQLEIFL